MEIWRDSVNRKTHRIELKNLRGSSRLKKGDTITITNVKEKKLFHDPDDPESPDCTIKHPSEVRPQRTYGDAVFDPNEWKEGDPVFDPNGENS